MKLAWPPIPDVDIGLAAVCQTFDGGQQLTFSCGCRLVLEAPGDTDQLNEVQGCSQWHFGLWRIGVRLWMKRRFHGTPLESGYLA